MGLGRTGNPMTDAELDRLQEYVRRVRQPQIAFTPEEAKDLRELAERVAQEHVGEPGVTDLETMALFIFAVFALAPLLKGE